MLTNKAFMLLYTFLFKTMLKKDVSVENVLNGFSSFLDRMLEGSVRRYYIPEWPDNLKWM